MPEFIEFEKISRLSRECIVTEKIDGTNGTIYIGEDGEFLVGSRSRWITPDNDNYGFAKWAYEHKHELLELGPGWHRGEWWGLGIQRGYGLKEKRFSLFNTSRWNEEHLPPSCCHIVPVLYTGMFDTEKIFSVLNSLGELGSVAAYGFPKPEGIVCYHTASRVMFKKTLLHDEEPKSKVSRPILEADL